MWPQRHRVTERIRDRETERQRDREKAGSQRDEIQSTRLSLLLHVSVAAVALWQVLAMNMIRTLIVDDEELARKRLRRMLAPFGDVDVIGEAESGADAVTKIGRASCRERV